MEGEGRTRVLQRRGEGSSRYTLDTEQGGFRRGDAWGCWGSMLQASQADMHCGVTAIGATGAGGGQQGGRRGMC